MNTNSTITNTKKELNDYCVYNNVPFSIDVSNLSPVYARNKIRLNYINNLTKTEKLLIKKNIDEENKENEKIKENIKSKIEDNSLDINELKRMDCLLKNEMKLQNEKRNTNFSYRNWNCWLQRQI